MNALDRIRPFLPRWSVAVGLAAVGFGLGWCWGPVGSETHSDRGEGPATRPADAHRHEADETWTCSMHPQIRRSEPGDCPICGMDLVPASSVEAEPAQGSDGPSRFQLSPRARRLARIETTAVTRGEGTAERRLLGRLEWDETRLHDVTAWVGGRVERLRVATTGVRVRRGQPVAVLYSPEIYSAQRDLRVAREQLESLAEAEASARRSAQAAVQAARRRLALLGVPPVDLERMAEAEEPPTEVAIRSTVSGTVLERLVTEGQYVKTGDPLYRVADLSKLWVQLDAYESEVGALDLGDPVELRVPAHPELELTGRVQFVEPTVDPQTRVAKVRIEVDNRGGRLRPGMYVEAIVQAGLGLESPLVVPESAVIFTGRRSLVYVEVPGTERPTYEPRTVEVGALLDDAYVVEAGIEAGERVVVEGAFVLDTELQIRGGPSAMAATTPADPEWTRLVKTYLEVQGRLADDDPGAAREAAARVAEASRALDDPTAGRLEQAAVGLSQSSDLDAARSAFEEMSGLLLDLLAARGNPLAVPLRLTHCPMVDGDRGAAWLQTDEEVDNPYFGAQMQTCGSVRSVIAPGGRP